MRPNRIRVRPLNRIGLERDSGGIADELVLLAESVAINSDPESDSPDQGVLFIEYSSPTSPIPLTSCEFVRGDVNGDGMVDIADSPYLVAFLFLGGSAPGSLDAADANDDGIVDIADAVFVANVASGSAVPPAPFDAPGYDFTNDSLENDCRDALDLSVTDVLREFFAGTGYSGEHSWLVDMNDDGAVDLGVLDPVASEVALFHLNPTSLVLEYQSSLVGATHLFDVNLGEVDTGLVGYSGEFRAYDASGATIDAPFAVQVTPPGELLLVPVEDSVIVFVVGSTSVTRYQYDQGQFNSDTLVFPQGQVLESVSIDGEGLLLALNDIIAGAVVYFRLPASTAVMNLVAPLAPLVSLLTSETGGLTLNHPNDPCCVSPLGGTSGATDSIKSEIRDENEFVKARYNPNNFTHQVTFRPKRVINTAG